jgi:sulfur carrier protein ThiS
MKIKVEFVGAINTGPYKKEQDFEINEKTTIREFLETLHFDKGHLNFIQAVKNGSRCAHSETLKKGDKLELMLMVGGG